MGLATSALAQPSAGANAVVPKKISVAIVGDLIGPEHTADLSSPDLAAVARLMHSADLGFGNEEGAIFDYGAFKGYPAAENGGGLPLYNPAVTETYKAFGIRMLSKANNHAVDWGVEGLLATEAVLDQAGISHAGSGHSLTEATAPAYLFTPSGRVGLIATTSTFPGLSPAADATMRQGQKLAARPGQSVIHTRQINRISESDMVAIRNIAAVRNGSEPLAADAAQPPTVQIGEATFELSQTPGLHYEMNRADKERVVGAVAEARRNAGTVLFSIHAHETGNGGSEDPAPADFLPELFHAAIDNGADVVVRHGPHALKGIEIYKGKPIFYGMASLWFGVGYPNATMPYFIGETRHEAKLPASWYESVIAIVDFEGGHLKQVRLYPILLSATPATFGNPKLATGSDARRILERLKTLSLAYGTRVDIQDDTAAIAGDAH